MNMEEDLKKKKDAVGKAVELLLEGKIRNGIALDGIASLEGRKSENFKHAIEKRLKKLGKDHRVSMYFWDKKIKKGVQEDEGMF